MMNLVYVGMGALMQWVITTKEGKDFANKVVKKGCDIVIDSVKKSKVFSNGKHETGTADRPVSTDSGFGGDIQSDSKPETGNKSRYTSGTPASR